MDWLDVILILMLLIPTFIGWRRGLIGTVVPLVGFVVAILLAGQFYDSAAGWLSHWFHSPAQAKLLGFALIFILVLAAALTVASIARRLLSLLLLGWVDRIGGLVFGLLTGALISGALLSLVMNFFGSRVEATITNSTLATFLVDKFPLALYFLPGEFDSVRKLFT
jgi:membrane protein required for colicin V production